MAFIQRNTPQPNQKHVFSLKNFVGGLNNRSELMQENQCADVMNMAFYTDDVMEKRRGSTYFDTMAIGGPVTFIDEFKPYNEPEIMVRASKTELWVGNTKVANVAGQVMGTNYMGKYFFADSDKLRAYGRFPTEGGTYVKIQGEATSNYVLMEVVNPPNNFTPLDTSHVRGVTVYDYTNRKVWYEPCQNEIEDTFKTGNVIPEKVLWNGRVTAYERGIITAYDNDMVVRFLDKVIVKDDGYEVWFKGGIMVEG